MRSDKNLKIVNQPRRRAPENETPRERFVRIGTQRINKVFAEIAKLQALGNPAVYQVKNGEPEQIGEAIKAKVDTAVEAIKHPGRVPTEFKIEP